ncbi:MAG: PaaI family thioesterase [Hyphomonas sp.]|uniref:PaaI family thioesterase n=1 Tax=Hyphomonas sp. TaxID=87 RepID=UPI0034A01DD2
MLPDSEITPEAFTRRREAALLGSINMVVTRASRDGFEGHFDIQRNHHGPNAFLHAGALVLADWLCGYAAAASLKDGATGFRTIELKSSFFAAAPEGRIFAKATSVHIAVTHSSGTAN